MSLLLSKIPQFFSPDTPSGGGAATIGAPSTPQSKEDMIEFLSSDEETPETIELDKTPPKEGKKATKEKTEEAEETSEEGDEEEPDELAEIEAELEGPPEEKLELVTPVRRKEILTKYPNLFKDFPQLENSYYRDQQFTEMFGTVKDAKVVAEKADTLDRFEGEIMDGSIENVLKAVHEENKNGFYKIVDNYLSTLANVDERAYMHVLGNVTKHTIIAMVKESRRSKNDVLQSAAQILNQFVFGSSDFEQPRNLAKDTPKTEEDEKVNTREQELVQRQFTSARDDMDTRVNNTIRNTIEAHIDPRQSMSDYVRKNASKDALETLGSLIARDTRFTALTDKLWERAFQENFSKESTDRIRSAFLSKAKTLLPSVIKKARNEALRGTGHRVREEDSEESASDKSPVTRERPRTERSGKIKSGKDIPKGMSTLDFLNSD